MLRFIKTIIFTLFFIGSYAQVRDSNHDTLRSTLTKVFQTVKRYSVYRQQLDWNELQNKVLKDSTSILNYEDFRHRIELLFSSMGDKHAALFVNGDKISASDKPITSIKNTLISELKRTNPQLRTQILEDNYGYILIPSNSTKDNLITMAQAIQDSLCRLLKNQLNGIIIDLRANEGGSIYPLFTGLHQLIGDEEFLVLLLILTAHPRNHGSLKKENFFSKKKL